MAFDETKDKTIVSKILEFDKTKITVGVYSYNDGPKKLGISRVLLDAENKEKFAKLGRLTKEEVEKMIPALQEVSKEL